MDIARVPVLLGAAGLLTVSIVGLVGRDDGGPAAPAGPQAVAIADFEFGPVDLAVTVGDAVTWSNEDEAAHTVKSVGPGPIESGNLDQGEGYELAFTEPGTYAYLCQLHPFMKGTVEVSAA